jgi:hypothetical protein
MRPLLLVVVGVVGFLTVSALAQNPPATTPVRVAGTIEKLGSDNLRSRTSSPGIFLPQAGSRAATARSTRSKFGFSRRPCAASAKVSVRGTSSRMG